MNLNEQIENLATKSDFTDEDREVFESFKQALRDGEIRSAEKDSDGNWHTNAWVKQGILLGFKMESLFGSSEKISIALPKK